MKPPAGLVSSLGPLRRLLNWCLAGPVAALALCTAAPADAAWEVAYGDPAHSGFANVATEPARRAIAVTGLGTFTAPVIAQDGTLYIGTREGWLFALDPDGKVKWKRDITPKGHQIVGAPAIAGDGSIFVLGRYQVTDHTSGQSVERFETTLHHFSAGGAYLGATPFPDRFSGPTTSAVLNIVRVGSNEAVVVPAIYPNRLTGGYEIRLLAFSVAPVPEVIADTKVRTFVPTVRGGIERPDSWLCRSPIPVLSYLTCLGLSASGFDGLSPPGPLRGPTLPHVRGAAVFTPPGGGAPHVLVSDGEFGLVAYSFSFANGFTLVSDAQLAGYVRSAPMVMPDGQSVIGLQNVIEEFEIVPRPGWEGRVYLGGPTTGTIRLAVAQAPVVAAPVRTAGNAIVVVEAGKGIAVLNQQGKIVSRVPVEGALSAVASRTHIFVATPNALVTVDASTMAEVGRGAATGANLAIGPDGSVYSVRPEILFVFRPAAQAAVSGQVFEAVDVLDHPIAPISPSAATTPKPLVAGGSGRFHDPKGPGGLALYACTAVGGDVCERPVAVKFCQSRGFVKVAKYDTDNKKLKAETLGGEICTKKRCRVFEYIECRN